MASTATGADEPQATISRLAELVRELNATLRSIAALIDRPAQLGHAGEFIAARIFDVQLHPSAVTKAQDGVFGPSTSLAGCSVNIKWYPTDDGLLDLTPDPAAVDFYLVLAGPRVGAVTSKHTHRPWVIERVYLFHAPDLLKNLNDRGIGIGAASSVRRHLWDEAEIYPEQRNQRLLLTPIQREMLAYFSSAAVN